jgi:hypothetical protein
MGLLFCSGYNGPTVLQPLQWAYCFLAATMPMGLLFFSGYNGPTVV